MTGWQKAANAAAERVHGEYNISGTHTIDGPLWTVVHVPTRMAGICEVEGINYFASARDAHAFVRQQCINAAVAAALGLMDESFAPDIRSDIRSAA